MRVCLICFVNKFNFTNKYLFIQFRNYISKLYTLHKFPLFSLIRNFPFKVYHLYRQVYVPWPTGVSAITRITDDLLLLLLRKLDPLSYYDNQSVISRQFILDVYFLFLCKSEKS